MFLKLLALIIFTATVAVVLLGYRQQRLEVMNEMTRLHGQIDQSRQAMWDLQVKIADHVEPPALLKAIGRAQLKLESTTPVSSPTGADGESEGNSRNSANTDKPTDSGDIHQTNAPAQPRRIITAD